MKLLQLQLTNFQGIKSFTFTPGGENANVYGTNAAGKTTLFNAMTWLLFDKASTGEKGFVPKTKGPDGQDLHYLNHCVDGRFSLDDGQIITFSKDLHEEWVKKRGSNVENFSGHKTDYFVDGVPTSKSEYEDRLLSIVSPLMSQILTQPDYFPKTMSWQDRRKLLLEVCGDVSDFEVINSNTELALCTSYLLKPGTEGQFYTVDEYRAIAKVQADKINLRLKEIPSRIDEATMALPNTAGIDERSIRDQITILQNEQNELSVKKANLSSGEATQTSRRQISDIQTAIAKGRTAHAEKYEESVKENRQLVNRLHEELANLTRQSLAVASAIEINERILWSIKSARERLSDEYRTIQAKEWKGDTICSTCGQALPPESVQAAVEKFNIDKSISLENIRAKIEAECSKVIIAEKEEALSTTIKEYNDLQDRINALKDDIDRDTKAMPLPTAYEDTDEYVLYSNQIKDLQAKLTAGDDIVSEQQKTIQSQIDEVRQKINTLVDKLALLKTSEQQQKRIEELMNEEKDLSAGYEKLSQGLYLCELFVKTKVSLLDEKINSKFTSVKFKLFEEQINGGIKETCEVMIPCPGALVPYPLANPGSKIPAGLEIINTLSKHWGITMPVFVDNCESIVKLPNIESQLIKLIVSEKDEVLRVVIDD